MLTVTGLTKRFHGHTALDGCSLAVSPGRTTALIGPSGCGKSTLLRALVGLVLPDDGVVAFDGKPVARADWPALRRRIGYVIQDGGLFPHLTAEGNVTLQARELGVAEARRKSRLAELSELVKLGPRFLAAYPGQLSGGQRQRVSLMRALFLDPDVLLLDEPMGALDPLIRAGLQSDLREIFSRLGKTVVLVTHDLGEAAYLGDTLVLMRDGRIVQCGTARDFVTSPASAFVRRFVDTQRDASRAAAWGGMNA